MPTATQSIREIVSAPAVGSRSPGALRHRSLRAGRTSPLEAGMRGLQLSVDQVLEKLADAEDREHGTAPGQIPTGYSLSRLIQHIVRAHHQHVRQELPRMAEMAQKVAENTAIALPN